MEVQRMMRHSVRTCHPNDSLNDAAQIMWEDVCGSVPVVDDQLKLVGFLTDRDICMAAYTKVHRCTPCEWKAPWLGA